MRFCLPSGHCPRAGALAVAARAAGHTVVACARSEVASRIEHFDILLCSGFASLKREQVAAVIAAGHDAWVFDLGYFHRDHHQPGAYFQISVNGLARIPNQTCNAARWQALGLPIGPDLPGRARSGPILICAQKFGDNQHRMDQTAMAAWIKRTVAAIRARTDRTITLRPHPASSAWSVRDSHLYDEWQDPKRVPIEQAIGNAYAVVTYNSTVGLECIRQGVPVFCDKTAADYYPLSSFNLADYIHQPWAAALALRAEYLHRVAYGQWTQREHEDGTALAFMRDYTDYYRHNLRAADLAALPHRLGIAA